MADRIATVFAVAGIDVAVQPSTVTSPMICRPQANVAYRHVATGVVAYTDEMMEE